LKKQAYQSLIQRKPLWLYLNINGRIKIKSLPKKLDIYIFEINRIFVFTDAGA